jgi:hypothetical protein
VTPATVQYVIESTKNIKQPPTNFNTLGEASLLPALPPAYIHDEVINYSTSDGMKLCNPSIAPHPIQDFGRQW